MIKVFKSSGKTYYAVTQNPECVQAIKEVIRYKKEKLSDIDKFNIDLGRIIKKQGRIELWRDMDTNEGDICWIITKK